MGASAKRKKEKKADFAKPKLRVGKTAPKAANSTSTAFKARSIVLNQTSLSADAPSILAHFTHQLSLVSSKQESQRKDALASVTNSLHAAKAQAQSRIQNGEQVSSTDIDHTLPLPAVTIIHKIRPLLLDPSKSIRDLALKLLSALPTSALQENTPDILIYAHIGLTHMVAAIRTSSLDVLELLLQTAGSESVSSPGGWTGSMSRLLTMLSWEKEAVKAPIGEEEKGGYQEKWSTAPQTGTLKPDAAKLKARQITLLALLLETGLKPPPSEELAVKALTARQWPLVHVQTHVIGDRANPFGYLNLFGAVRNEEESVAGDSETRREVVLEGGFFGALVKGVGGAKREGGEVGRAATGLAKVIDLRLKDN